MIYSSANQQLFNLANDEDWHFIEFNNFIYMKERRGSLKCCGSIESSLSRLVEEKIAFKSSCSYDWNGMIFEWENVKKYRKEMEVSNYSNFFQNKFRFRGDNWTIIAYLFNLFAYLFLPILFLFKGMGSSFLSASTVIFYGLAILFISFCTISFEYENYQRKYFHIEPSSENSVFDVFCIDLYVISRIILNLSTTTKETLQSM